MHLNRSTVDSVFRSSSSVLPDRPNVDRFGVMPSAEQQLRGAIPKCHDDRIYSQKWRGDSSLQGAFYRDQPSVSTACWRDGRNPCRRFSLVHARFRRPWREYSPVWCRDGESSSNANSECPQESDRVTIWPCRADRRRSFCFVWLSDEIWWCAERKRFLSHSVSSPSSFYPKIVFSKVEKQINTSISMRQKHTL